MSETREQYKVGSRAEGGLAVAAQLIQDMLDAQGLLRQAVDELGVVLWETLEDQKVRELKALAATQARELAQARRDLVGEWIARQELADYQAVTEMAFTLAWKESNGAGTIDPVTGKANKEHTEMVLARALGLNEGVTNARQLAGVADRKYREKQAEVEGLVDQLSATRAIVNLTSAELNLLAGPVQGLVGLTKLVGQEV